MKIFKNGNAKSKIAFIEKIHERIIMKTMKFTKFATQKITTLIFYGK